VQFQNQVVAFLTFDDEHHRFAFGNMAVLQPNGTERDRQGAIGVDHLGFSYRSLRELLENFDVLKRKEITPYWSIHHGITVSLYYADPDGNQVEFQVDCMESSEDAAALMATMFGANPVGVEFDPVDWLARLRHGTPERDLLTRTAHEPVSPLRGSITQYLSGP